MESGKCRGYVIADDVEYPGVSSMACLDPTTPAVHKQQGGAVKDVRDDQHGMSNNDSCWECMIDAVLKCRKGLQAFKPNFGRLTRGSRLNSPS